MRLSLLALALAAAVACHGSSSNDHVPPPPDSVRPVMEPCPPGAEVLRLRRPPADSVAHSGVIPIEGDSIVSGRAAGVCITPTTRDTGPGTTMSRAQLEAVADGPVPFPSAQWFIVTPLQRPIR